MFDGFALNDLTGVPLHPEMVTTQHLAATTLGPRALRLNFQRHHAGLWRWWRKPSIQGFTDLWPPTDVSAGECVSYDVLSMFLNSNLTTIPVLTLGLWLLALGFSIQSTLLQPFSGSNEGFTLKSRWVLIWCISSRKWKVGEVSPEITTEYRVCIYIYIIHMSLIESKE